MNKYTLLQLFQIKTALFAPAEEAGGGGDTTDGEAKGSDGVGEAEDTSTTDTVLGGDQADGKTDDTGDATDDDAKDDDEAGEGKDDKDETPDEADQVPEDGSYEFELPEGVELSDEDKESWSKQFSEIGLTRAQAQSLIAAQAERVAGEQKAFSDFLQKQQSDHLEAAKKDKDIGGDKWAETQKLANAGLKLLGGDAIKKLILSSGNGNNPEMIRELRRLGELAKDDTFESGSSTEATVPTEKSWYGDTTPDTKKG